MERKRSLTLLNCFCCSESFKINDLIEMKSNSVLIGSQTMDFCDLILDVCFCKMALSREAFICCDCKDHLVNFHIFKKKVKQYKNLEQHLKTVELLLNLEEIIASTDYLTENSQIMHFEDIEIHIRSKQKVETFEMIQLSQSESKETSHPLEDPLSETPRKKRKVEKPSRYVDYEMRNKKMKKSSDPMVIEALEPPPDESPHLPSAESAISSKWNTNSSLTEEQKNWIQETAQKCKVKDGNKIVFKCSECDSQLSSSWVLRKHLRDVHVLKPQKNPKANRRGKDFMEEVRSCKMTVELEDGNSEVVWKCKRCDSVMRSESGFIKHLLYLHIRNTSIHPSFIARCKIAIEYDDPEKTSEFGWRCPECGNFYKSAVGLKNHCKLEHNGVDFGGEIYQRKVKQIADRALILKEEEKQSEIILETEDGPRKIWHCQRCREARYFKSESGFKNHVRHEHLKNRRIDEKKISSCQVAKQKLWQCSLCEASTKTKEGFISHVNLEHPGEFDAEDLPEVEEITRTPVADRKPISIENLVTSLRGVLKADGYKFSCNECGLYFRKHYPTHVAAHETLKQLNLTYQLPKCEDCQVLYCRDEDIVRHLEWHDGDMTTDTAFPLKGLAYFGGKEFKHPAGTADNALESESTWKCGHCLAIFWDELECVHHLTMMHMEVLICPIDNLEFLGSRGLTQFCSHMKHKHPELFSNLTFPCTYCHTEFQNSLDKLAHMKRCSAKNLECDGCGKKFFSKVKLAHHLKIETGLLSYECSICDKKCASSMDLKLHVIGTHTNARPYPCTFEDCDKAFKTSAARSSHMESHSDTIYRCSICNRDFKKRAAFMKHVKLAHSSGFRTHISKRILAESV